ncbi:MAG: DUF1553 domain-containing protein, partial [Planctomycetota bacterium]
MSTIQCSRFGRVCTMRVGRVTRKRRFAITCAMVVAFLQSVPGGAFGDPISRDDIAFFETKVRPLLARHCVECHGAEEPSGELRLDDYESLIVGGASGPAVVPGKPSESLLIDAINHNGYEMPPDGKLMQSDIETLTHWVRLGAPWPGADPNRPVRKREQFTREDRSWWAIQPIQNPVVPEIDASAYDFSRNEIDAFLLEAMKTPALRPAGQADAIDLVRRAYLDTVGVPPSPGEVDAFLGDPSADSYDALVDQLLNDTRFGEHHARAWLDLVRYAESDGYRADGYRPDAWRYRDYVIDAFNSDKPYDRFVQEQLAADELFPDDLQAQVGLGFLRHWVYEWNIRDARTQWNTILEDVTDSTADVFLGLGLQCAKCHNHKFDPLLQKDYFRLRAFFEPLLPTETPLANQADIAKHQDQLANWEAATESLRDQLQDVLEPYREKYRDIAIDRFPRDLQSIARKQPGERTPHEEQLAYLIYRQVLAEYERLDSHIKGDEKEQLVKLRRQLAEFDTIKPAPLPMGMTVTDVASTSSPTLLPKGRRQSVLPGVPSIVDSQPLAIDSARVSQQRYWTVNTNERDCVQQEQRPLSEFRQLNPHLNGLGNAPSGTTTGRRSALAQWMTSPDNPFVARVIVNRIWQQYFGRGLAANPSDFGMLGGAPTHPKLLDWLAQELIRNNWRLKSIHRLILTSAAYSRSVSHSDCDRQQEIDPENQFYWRRSAQRLTAEQIRDSLLSVSGRLQPRSGGESVHADQPYRSIYLRVRRNTADPLLRAFDAPQRFTSSSSRNTTTTPLQSLLMFNGDTLLQHARSLATSIGREDSSPDDQIRVAWRRVFGREIRPAEALASLEFLKRQTEILEQQNRRRISTPIPTGQLPFRDGRAVSFVKDDDERHHDHSLLIPDAPAFHLDDFTIESFFQLRSIADSGAVRTILSKYDAKQGRRGWKFGVTGKGSR